MINILEFDMRNTLPNNKIVSNDYLKNYTYLEYILFPELFEYYIKQLQAKQIFNIFNSYASSLRQFAPELQAFNQQGKSQLLKRLLNYAKLQNNNQRQQINQKKNKKTINKEKVLVIQEENQSQSAINQCQNQMNNDQIQVMLVGKFFVYSKLKINQLSNIIENLYQSICQYSKTQKQFLSPLQLNQNIQKSIRFISNILFQSQNFLQIKKIISKRAVSRGLINLLSLLIQRSITYQEPGQMNNQSEQIEKKPKVGLQDILDPEIPTFIYYQCIQMLRDKYLAKKSHLNVGSQNVQEINRIEQMLNRIDTLPVLLEFKEMQFYMQNWQTKYHYFNTIKYQKQQIFNFYWLYIASLATLQRLRFRQNSQLKQKYLYQYAQNIATVYSRDLLNLLILLQHGNQTQNLWATVLNNKNSNQKTEKIVKSFQNLLNQKTGEICLKVLDKFAKSTKINQNLGLMMQEQYPQLRQKQIQEQLIEFSQFQQLYYSIARGQLNIFNQKVCNSFLKQMQNQFGVYNEQIKHIVLNYQLSNSNKLQSCYQRHIQSMQNNVCLFSEQLRQIGSSLMKQNKSNETLQIQNLNLNISKTKQKLYIHLISLQILQYSAKNTQFSGQIKQNDLQLNMQESKKKVQKLRQFKQMFQQILYVGTGNPSLETVVYFLSSFLSFTNFKSMQIQQKQEQYSQNNFLDQQIKVVQFIYIFFGQIIKYLGSAQIVIKQTQMKYVKTIISIYQLINETLKHAQKRKQLLKATFQKSASQQSALNILQQMKLIQINLVDRLYDSNQLVPLINSNYILQKLTYIALADTSLLNLSYSNYSISANQILIQKNQFYQINYEQKQKIINFHISNKQNNNKFKTDLYSKYAKSALQVNYNQEKNRNNSNLSVKIIQKYVSLSKFKHLRQVTLQFNCKKNQESDTNIMQQYLDFNFVKDACRASFLNLLLKLAKINQKIKNSQSLYTQSKNYDNFQLIQQMKNYTQELVDLQIDYIKQLNYIFKLKIYYLKPSKNQNVNQYEQFLDFFQEAILLYITKLKQLKIKAALIQSSLKQQNFKQNKCRITLEAIQTFILIDLSRIPQIDYQFLQQLFQSKVASTNNETYDIQKYFQTLKFDELQFHIKFIHSKDFLQYFYQYFPIKINSRQQQKQLYQFSVKWSQDSKNHQWLSAVKESKNRQQKLTTYLKYLQSKQN